MISEVFNMDCMDYMATCKDKQFDLAIVDPIYGIKEPAFRRTAKNKATQCKKYKGLSYKQKKTGSAYFKELFRISTNQIIWGGNYFIDHLKSTRCMIVWDKGTQATQWADAELAWTSFNNSVRIFKFDWNGMIQGDMKNKEVRIHENQKPVTLYKWLLKNYAKEGDSIIDTHLGSGSSRIACYEGGFDFTGIEIDKEYFDDSVKRFENYKLQLKLSFV
jgi:site-specific DNA-methyltransferase (adenine-specific)